MSDRQLHPESLVVPYMRIDYDQLENRSSYALSSFAQANVPLPLRFAQVSESICGSLGRIASTFDVSVQGEVTPQCIVFRMAVFTFFMAVMAFISSWAFDILACH